MRRALSRLRRSVVAFPALLRETYFAWRADQGSFLGAAMAYYAAFSIVPLLILVVSSASAVFGAEAARSSLAEQLESVLGANTTAMVIGLLDGADGSQFLATAAGLLMLVYGASGMFGRLRAALNVVWDVRPPPRHPVASFLRDRLIPFLMVLVATILVLASFFLGAALSLLRRDLSAVLRIEAQALRLGMAGIDLSMPDLATSARSLEMPLPSLAETLPELAARIEPLESWVRSLQFADFALSFILASLLFALVFKFVPDTPVEWGDVWLGALLSGVLFGVGKLAIQLYLMNASIVTAYGAAGSLVAILLWANYSAQILFLGAEFTKVFAYRHGSRASEMPPAGAPTGLA